MGGMSNDERRRQQNRSGDLPGDFNNRFNIFLVVPFIFSWCQGGPLENSLSPKGREKGEGGDIMSKLTVWIAAITGSILFFYFLDLLIMKAYFGAALGLNLFPR